MRGGGPIDWEANIYPRFTSEQDRDERFARWAEVTGNQLRNGVRCSIDHQTYEYREGQWHAKSDWYLYSSEATA